MIFTDPSLLLVGAALTGLILVGLWSYGVRRRKLARFLGGRRALDRVSRTDLSRFGLRRTILLGFAGLALGAAAADPHWSEAPEALAPIKRAIIAIDVSASMQATDVAPTRLAQATQVAHEVLESLEGHEVGLVLYAGRPYPLAPPTQDLDAIRFLLSGVAPTMASAYDPGTIVSRAIDEAVALLEREPDSASVSEPPPPPEEAIIFISDGDSEEPDEDLAEALVRATEADIAVHAVGIGTAEGAGMVMPRGTYQLGGPIVDASGAPGRSRLDEGLLRRLAQGGNGLFVHAGSPGDMSNLEAELSAPTVPPDPDPTDAPPVWAAYDLPFVLGLMAFACVLLESLIGVALPRLATARAREAT